MIHKVSVSLFESRVYFVHEEDCFLGTMCTRGESEFNSITMMSKITLLIFSRVSNRTDAVKCVLEGRFI